jgi:hypothetical protein
LAGNDILSLAALSDIPLVYVGTKSGLSSCSWKGGDQFSCAIIQDDRIQARPIQSLVISPLGDQVLVGTPADEPIHLLISSKSP